MPGVGPNVWINIQKLNVGDGNVSVPRKIGLSIDAGEFSPRWGSLSRGKASLSPSLSGFYLRISDQNLIERRDISAPLNR